MTDLRDLALFAFAVAGFALWWCAVVWMIAKIGGWAALAARYRANRPFVGRAWHGQSASFGGLGNYRNCLSVGWCEAGVYLRPMLLFRAGHAPLLVPWADVTLTEGRQLGFLPVLLLTAAAVPGVRLALTGAAADGLRQESRRALRYVASTASEVR